MSSLKIHEPRPWDSIKSLEVRFYDVWDEPGPQDSHPDSIFKHIPPTVSSLYLYLEDRDDIVAINDGLHLHIPEIVLTNLTTFTFSCDWDGTMMLQILQSCTNVENLTLDFRGSSVAFQDAPLLREAGLLLPKVRILHLDQIISGAVSSIQALRTPSLVELRISFVTDVIHPVAFTNRAYVSDNFASSVLSFVRASGCQGSLRKFRFDSISIPNPQLVAILTNLPFLTHLALDNTFFDPTPFGKYDYVYGGSALLPCLAVLELLRLPPDFPRDAMSHFAVARKLELPPGGLKKFVMTFRKYQPPDLSLLVDKFKNTFPIETTCFAFV
ncbi:hypothetical protein EST38_g435 [Candolleomyces aberdarensis]|uniref:Uncharacterized protein n=1 Tax=Candolleomyces aberdarensis TaxID=2316362 RepID=A0A4Q2DZJ0_9AGAR|nr:hypothetical protein EST38_g435 [Candolleomyces aberdarensis]